MPDAIGMGAALLGFLLIMVYGTAFGLMFSCVNVIFRDFQRIVQTFINMVPFTAPMMYPYWITLDRFGGGIWHELYLANPVAEAVQLIQRGFWYPTCAPNCAVMPNPNGDGTSVPAPEFADHLFTRGFIMLGSASSCSSCRPDGVRAPREVDPGAPLMTTSILVDNVTKTFRYQYHRTLKQVLSTALAWRSGGDSFKALDGVSFEVQQGESIGLMGLNGSGQVHPAQDGERGDDPRRGRGAHPRADLRPDRHRRRVSTTSSRGRDNIYMNAAMLGMSKEETDAKFDDIAAFADVGRQLDMPVGNYSSGSSPASVSPSRSTSTATSSSPTRCWRWGTGPSSASASSA